MDDLTESEVDLLWDMLDEVFEEMCHHPEEYTEGAKDAYETLREKVRNEAKRLNLWWVK